MLQGAASFQHDAAILGLDLSASLPSKHRVPSPSDFGFHNAMVEADGRLRFFDFEYAGWDDPAKAVGDFFSHPGVAVPQDQFEPFVMQALAPYEENAQHMATRVRLLEPISQVKWCCIILNEFLPAAARRRNFANPGANPPVGGGPTAALDLTKTYNKASIFSDFGLGNGGGTLPASRTYYFDNLSFVAP